MEEDKCFSCKHFLDIGNDGKCDIYDIPNHEVSICSDWRQRRE